MPTLNLSETQVVELAKQLPPEPRRELAIALLRKDVPARSLRGLRNLAQPELARALRDRGLNLETMTSSQVEEAIRQICEEP
jgi:hypothetical protein